MYLCLVISAALMTAVSSQQPCVPRDYGEDSVVCVCNATYCDVAEQTTAEQLSGDVIRHYESNKAGRRLEAKTMHFTTDKLTAADETIITVKKDTTFQKIMGFGGAMTDSAGINIKSLSEGAQKLLLDQYFSPRGIQYTFIRVPIGGTDFSTHHYSYDDTVDETLQNFNLSMEDYEYKIPLIKQAQEISSKKIKLFGSAWSAPDWMKNVTDNGKHSLLLPEYYQLWADYYIKFLDFYAEEGLTFWGITTQNEPYFSLDLDNVPHMMGWTMEQQKKWLIQNLGPTLRDNDKYSDTVIMILDDDRQYAEQCAEESFGDNDASEFTQGMAVHWYNDTLVPVKAYDEIHQNFPDKFILSTEACVMLLGSALPLGTWGHGQQYITDIIEVTNHWVTGWVDWNLALDLQGGPNYINNFVNSPIIVNATADEFYKQPLFYALAHVSMFVPEGSVRIELDVENDNGLETVAFRTPEDITVLIIHNREENNKKVTYYDQDKGNVQIMVSASSINTLLYM